MIVFTGSLSDVNSASNKIYCNILRYRSQVYSDTLINNPPNGDIVNISSMSDSEISNIPLLGYRNGSINRDDGYTTKWDIPKERDDLPGQYWIYKHQDPSMNIGVVNVLEEEKQDSWDPDPGEI